MDDEDKIIINRLFEYCQYMYEEENRTRDILNNVTKIYLGVIGLLSGLIMVKTDAIDTIAILVITSSKLPSVGSYLSIFAITAFTTTGLLFLAAAIFTLLTVKIWIRERLCDPEIMIEKASGIENEERLLSKMCADYAVAANRNFIVNEKKANSLSKGLYCLIFAIFIFILTGVILQIANLVYGGSDV